MEKIELYQKVLDFFKNPEEDWDNPGFCHGFCTVKLKEEYNLLYFEAYDKEPEIFNSCWNWAHDLVFGIYYEYPEIVSYKPQNKDFYWFDTTQERIDVLEEIINNLKNGSSETGEI